MSDTAEREPIGPHPQRQRTKVDPATAPAGDPSTNGGRVEERVGDSLAGIREEVEQLVRQLDGPVARVAVRSGEAMIEVEWSHGVAANPGPPAVPVAPPARAPALADGVDGMTPDDPSSSLHAVRAPLVGTFYAAPEPNAPPFVRPGDLVEASTTIGIIEAMKMMNHISAERAGLVAELLVTNGEAVEFGQELVRIEPLDG